MRFSTLLLRVALCAALALVLTGASCNGGDPNVLTGEEILQCGLVESLIARPSEPETSLFRDSAGACEEVVVSELDGLATTELFADDACSVPVPFRGTSFVEFCGFQLLGTDRTRRFVGNPDAWIDVLPDAGDGIATPWTLARETTLQVGALDQTELPRPYVQRVQYRRVGECSLGMRVYVPRLGADDLRPAVVLHGGGWRFRGAGAVAGIGTIVPQLTSRGFAVFAPFHRLTGESDGPAACGGADGEAIVEDVEAALDWVLAHGTDYGVDPAATRVAVVGQSSGGHLATWLTVHRAEDVNRALLLYPLVDVPFLVGQLGAGGIFEGRFERGEPLLLAFVNEPGVTVAAEISPDSEFVARNSFVQQIGEDPDAFADFDIVHGDSDRVVPVELSVRLCRAKDPEEDPSNEAWPGGDADLSCGDGGSATVVAGAEHVLDLRCFTGEKAQVLALVDDDLGGLCAAGSELQEARVREALRAAYDRF